MSLDGKDEVINHDHEIRRFDQPQPKAWLHLSNRESRRLLRLCLGQALAPRFPPLADLCGSERRDQASSVGGDPMIPPMAAVFTRMLCQTWKIVGWGVFIASVAELFAMEFGNA